MYIGRDVLVVDLFQSEVKVVLGGESVASAAIARLFVRQHGDERTAEGEKDLVRSSLRLGDVRKGTHVPHTMHLLEWNKYMMTTTTVDVDGWWWWWQRRRKEKTTTPTTTTATTLTTTTTTNRAAMTLTMMTVTRPGLVDSVWSTEPQVRPACTTLRSDQQVWLAGLTWRPPTNADKFWYLKV